MFIQPYDYFLAFWFILVGLSVGYVAFDQFYNKNPEPTVMKWGFILITLYTGPFGLLMYVLADKEPRPGEHEEFVSSLWKQGIGSTIHCLAGDATGIILAAVITGFFGLPMWIDLIIEYIAGFSFGLFIFQSLFMKKLMGGTYWQNVRSTFLPEFISMNGMMAAMAPVMIFLMMDRDMRAMQPTQLLFWGVMSIGVMAGFALSYPFNVWMVKKKLKHGLMTVRAPNTHASHEMPGADEKEEHQMNMSDATIPQKAAVAGVATFMVIAGMVTPSGWVNMSLGAKDVGGSIMPPGMVMPFDEPAEAMREMAAVLPNQVSYDAPADAKGDQVLQPRIENGVKIYDIEASVIKWYILPGVTVDAYAYNHQIPGPHLALTEGDHVRINFTNHLPESTTVHWHGLIVPNSMDGPANVTQKPIEPGQSFTYEFTVAQSGTYFYHSHDHSDRQQALGLYGALIIAPKDPTAEPKADIDYVVQLQEWLKRGWLTYPAMLMEGGLPNYFTVNGKAYPATETIPMKIGQTLKVRFIGSNNNFIHPMHIHGGPFQVVAVDGNTLPENQRYLADTVNVGPGQRYDVIWTARKPGKWLIHCHIPHHTSNNNVETEGGGGLMLVVNVEE
jgi:FtsP/CotA-like multicopper oxidase with cupredoxin domain